MNRRTRDYKLFRPCWASVAPRRINTLHRYTYKSAWFISLQFQWKGNNERKGDEKRQDTRKKRTPQYPSPNKSPQASSTPRSYQTLPHQTNPHNPLQLSVSLLL